MAIDLFRGLQELRENKDEILRTINRVIAELGVIIESGTEEERGAWEERVGRYGFQSIQEAYGALGSVSKNFLKVFGHTDKIPLIRADLKGEDGLLRFLDNQTRARRAREFANKKIAAGKK